jgi:tetratricopeptide (TPR) repeat protein
VLVARIVSIEGTVKVAASESAPLEEAQPDQSLCAGNVVEVGELSRAALLLPNETTIRLDQRSRLVLSGFAADQSSALALTRGALHVITRTRQRFQVTTPFVNANVNGTEFTVRVDGAGAAITVVEGAVAATRGAEALSVRGGESLVSRPNEPLRKEIVVRRTGAVEWALYYPAVFDCGLGERITTWRQFRDAEQITALCRAGNFAEAIARLDLSVPADDPRVQAFRAGMLLAVGRYDQARASIDEALRLDANDSTAYALRAIAALVRDGSASEALGFASKAVELDPASASAAIALSYAEQAVFRIDRALKAIQAIPPDSRTAASWARLAELYLSTGEIDAAESAANRAIELDASVSKAYSIQGYAYLLGIHLRAATTAFEQAIARDQADPYARLGLGLTRIRSGDLEGGRQLLEVAAILDPGSSLVRSYLGKAYYEEKRDRLALEQYDLAKELDPEDPTPWFYEAILQQSVNRPIVAAQDLEKSIELNGNRAVYRSKLLVDEDAAARGSTLARTFIELDLPEAATTLAARSLAQDPGNPAAHRFLSDLAADRPRSDIVRASELLQAQLRQPLSVIPLQAQLANDQLLLMRGIGPSALGLNEYTSLYAGNGVGLEAYGVVGSNDTSGQQVLAYTLIDRFAISASELTFRSDGVRANGDTDRKQATVLMQAALTSTTGLQLEYAYNTSTTGDLVSRFDPGNFIGTLRNDDRDETFRLGVRQVLSPASDVLLVATRRDRKTTADFGDDFSIAVENISTKIELQHLWRADHVSVMSGLTYLEADTTEEIFGFQTPSKPHHFNVYSYVTFHAQEETSPFVQAGLSYDRLHSRDAGDEEQLNPKLGLIWNPVRPVTLRAAIFRALKRRINEDAGLEPSNVVGFAQYFDDANGTKYWGAGAALDARLSNSTRIGLDAGGRNLKVPLTNVDQTIEFDPWRERAAGGYAHWLLGEHAALSARVRYSRFERLAESRGDEDFVNVKTTELPLSFRYFADNGIWGQLNVTHVRQRGQFNSAVQELFDASQNFTVVDAAVGYRLPSRWGNTSVECTNLFNQSFRFQDVGLDIPRYVPDRRCLFRLSLSF